MLFNKNVVCEISQQKYQKPDCHVLSPAGNSAPHSFLLIPPPVGWAENGKGKREKIHGLR